MYDMYLYSYRDTFFFFFFWKKRKEKKIKARIEKEGLGSQRRERKSLSSSVTSFYSNVLFFILAKYDPCSGSLNNNSYTGLNSVGWC